MKLTDDESENLLAKTLVVPELRPLYYVGSNIKSMQDEHDSHVDSLLLASLAIALSASGVLGIVLHGASLVFHMSIFDSIAKVFAIAMIVELLFVPVVLILRLVYYWFEEDDDPKSFFDLNSETHKFLKQAGLDTDFGKAFACTEVKSIYNEFYNLLLFANASDLNKQVADILAKYDKLPAIANGISRASDADILDRPSSKELLAEYLKQIKSLHHDLLELDRPYINKFVFELIKQKKFSYLPKHIERDYADSSNRKLLELIKKDED